MTTADLFWLLLAALVTGYWLNAMRITEMARAIGRKACIEAGVLFLDDSVIMNKMRLRRNGGQLRLWREYRFEFTSDGSRRYSGHINMLGKQLQDVQLDAYRVPAPPAERLH
jgi:hypothetical protein